MRLTEKSRDGLARASAFVSGLAASIEAKEFNPNQPRDRIGRWRRTGASAGGAPSVGESLMVIGHDRPPPSGLVTQADEPAAEDVLGSLDPETRSRVEELGLHQNLTARKTEAAGKLLGPYKDTKEKHRDDLTGAYGSERAKLHDKIVDKFLREKKPVFNGKFVEWVPDENGEYVAPPAKQAAAIRKRMRAVRGRTKEAKAIRAAYQEVLDGLDGKKRASFLAGGNASGKSTALYSPENKDVMKPGPHNVEINFDLVKAEMPEFRKLSGAKDIYATDATHFESADIARRLLDDAQAAGLSVVVDASGNSSRPGFSQMIKRMKGGGYETQVLMVDAPLPLAVKGMVSRGDNTGRYVPLAPMAKIHSNSVHWYRDWRQSEHVDQFTLYRRDEEGTHKVASGGGGGWAVHDHRRHAEVLAKDVGRVS